MKTACCIDLDGTLILSDSLIESVLLLLRKNPLYCFLMLIWSFRGRTYFKAAIAERTHLDPAHLPYNSAVIEWAKAKKEAGHPLYLVTAAHRKIADAVAKHLGLFDGVLASNAKSNLKGLQKANTCIQQFGDGNFIYVGNSSVDLPVWKHAQEIVCATHNRRLIQNCRKQRLDLTVLPKQKPRIKDYLKALRVHQYPKNILIFAPLFLDGVFNRLHLWETLLLYFMTFCITCSAVYIINDLYDLSTDRAHQKKRHRGFASGLITLNIGLILIPILIAASFLLQFYLHNLSFSLLLISYFILSAAYSQRLKEIAILDAMILTVLYTSRILAGMLIIKAPISDWFLSFSIFFFLSLSFLKRYIELRSIKDKKNSIIRRGYRATHDLFVKINGIACGCLSVFIFTLYIASVKAQTIYKDTIILYLIAFIIFYWIERIWLLAIEGKVHHDPVVFAMKDKLSYLLGAICVGIIMFAHIDTHSFLQTSVYAKSNCPGKITTNYVIQDAVTSC